MFIYFLSSTEAKNVDLPLYYIYKWKLKVHFEKGPTTFASTEAF